MPELFAAPPKHPRVFVQNVVNGHKHKVKIWAGNDFKHSKLLTFNIYFSLNKHEGTALPPTGNNERHAGAREQ